MINLFIEPECSDWPRLLRERAEGMLFDQPLARWREMTRQQLGVPVNQPVIATGHQSLLWHPGILVKYMLADAIADRCGWARANLIVDQHPGGEASFGSFEIPVRRRDGTLAVRRIDLTRTRPEVPMAQHRAFEPMPLPAGLTPALPSVDVGVRQIVQSVGAYSSVSDAAMQMALALEDLMSWWVAPMAQVSTTNLMRTTLARTLLTEMVRDPHRCASIYNEMLGAHRDIAEGIRPLLIRDDYVELPLWRLRDDGRRMHAYDADVHRWLEDPREAPALLPRALLMTALVRLGMCDLFVHGTGGGCYDRLMERWIERWLGVRPGPIAIATATLRLPLRDAQEPEIDVVRVVDEAHRVWHNPEPPADLDGAARIGPVKRELLEAVQQAPRRSLKRRAAYAAMHRELEKLRGVHAGRVEPAQRRAVAARQQQAEASIAERRDWAFPLYPQEMLDELAASVAARVEPCLAGE